MRGRLFHVFVAILTSLLAASCQPAGRVKVPPKAPAAGQPARVGEHWVQDQRLRTVMAELSSGMGESWPGELPDDPEVPGRPRRETFEKAAMLADALASAARRIPASIDKRSIPAADRRGFAAEASRLRDNALRLKEAAAQRRIEPMQRALDQIHSSCIACHSQYRDFAGELNAQKASLR